MNIDELPLVASITNVDNGGSDIRITAPAHGLTSGDRCTIAGVLGCTEANGTWAVTVLSSTQFTLDSSTHTNTYTSGGGVYAGGWRLQATLDATASPAIIVTVAYKKFPSETLAVSGIFTECVSVSTTTATTIIESRPDYAISIQLLNVLNGDDAERDIVLNFVNKAGTAYPFRTVTLPAGYCWTMDGAGVSEAYDPTGGRSAGGAIGAP